MSSFAANGYTDEVGRGVPSIFKQDDAGPVTSRLELGKWIVARDNPLTARVIVNHIWQLFFGAGLVRTPADFGMQGEMSTHPELLDWLAVDFMDHHWDLKHLVKRILTSRTYQQDSAVSAELLGRDPDNRLLARGARFRLPSWMIRDASLAASGLLNRTVGGPPIFAYQPPGVWQDQFMGHFTYQSTLGPDSIAGRSTPSAAKKHQLSCLIRRCDALVSCASPHEYSVSALTLLNDVAALEGRKLAERAGEGFEKPPHENGGTDLFLKTMFQLVNSHAT